MATNKKIQATELDFDGIKQSLKTFMQGQAEFSDYDFDGSALSILLDVLAYNTHYNALYTNLAINEAFLDSASKRASVVSKAKELGYVPHSARCATAVVDVLVIDDRIDAPSFFDIPRYTTFNTIIDGITYTFHTTQPYTARRVENEYVFSNVILKEGQPIVERYEVITPSATYTISNPKVDTTTLRVIVQETSQSSTSVTYTQSTSILNIDGASTVYFLKEIDNQYYEVEFGNGVVGKQLEAGNVITMEYIIGSEDRANGARTFTYNGTVSGPQQVYVTTITPAYGGTVAESIDSIKWNAPRAYVTQNRCVTVDDYKAVIRQLYADARSVNVWGGETATPPQYGKVFISVITNSGDNLTVAEKNTLLATVVNPRKPLSVIAEVIDPAPIDVLLKVSVYLNPNTTVATPGEIELAVQDKIQSYNDITLNTFGGVFKTSQLSTLLNTTDPGVTSNSIRVKLRRSLTPLFNTNARYEINLGNPIVRAATADESVMTTGLVVLGVERICYIDDDPQTATTGRLRLFYYNPQTNEKIIVRFIGTVDYSVGQVVIDNLNLTGIAGSSFDVLISPNSQDVVSTQNQFVRIDVAASEITLLTETSNSQYQFTPIKY